jgi:hypothetical protein
MVKCYLTTSVPPTIIKEENTVYQSFVNAIRSVKIEKTSECQVYFMRQGVLAVILITIFIIIDQFP